MTHIDLFSGIGGFALAAREVWGEDYNNVCFCDNNRFCQEVIKKNFGKESLIYGDIRELTRERIIADTDRHGFQESRTGQQTSRDRQLSKTATDTDKRKDNTGNVAKPRKTAYEESRTDIEIDLLTGGFPCQPFSQAGKRRGTSDDRHLWPEMLRVIKDTSPRWIIAENVRGLLSIEGGVVFEQVCLDLEREGYEVQPFIIPACAVNAPHRRDRIWIVAHSTGDRRFGQGKSVTPKKGLQPGPEYARKLEGGLERPHSNAPDTSNKGLQGGGNEGKGLPGQQDRTQCNERREWERNWLEVATELCRVDDGLPEGLYFLGKMMYNIPNGGTNEKCDNKKTEPKMDEFIWKKMREMWENRVSTSTPYSNAEKENHNTLRSMSCEGTQEDGWLRNLGENQKEKELCSMWEYFYSKSFKEAQNMFPEMLERIREIERTKKVGGLKLTKAGHRVERLKALGNAIVPQVAIEIMRAIKEVESLVKSGG